MHWRPCIDPKLKSLGVLRFFFFDKDLISFCASPPINFIGAFADI
jgi:hypothetical protein